MTQLQKRAWSGLGIGATLSAAIVAVLVTRGVTSVDNDLNTRLILYGLLAIWVVAHAIMLRVTSRRSGASEVLIDERDEVIATRAMRVQLWTLIGSLVVWAIALTEVYWDRGEIPVTFAQVILWSSLIVSFLAQHAGILLGYRSMGPHREDRRDQEPY